MVSTKFHYSRVFCRRLILLFPGQNMSSLLISPNLGPTPLFGWKSSSFCFANYVGWSFLVPFHVSGVDLFWLVSHLFAAKSDISWWICCYVFHSLRYTIIPFSFHQFPTIIVHISIINSPNKLSNVPILFLQILHFSQVSPSSPLENARSYPGFLHNAHHFSSISHPIPHKCPAFSLHFLVCFHISSMLPTGAPKVSQRCPKKTAPPGRGVVVLRGAAQLPDGAQKLCLGGVPVDAAGVENAFGLLERFLWENVYS